MAGNEQLTFALRAINQASSVLKEVQSDLGGLGDAAERSGQQVGAFDRKLALLSLGATAGLAGLGGAAVKLAMDFESSLSQVGAIAQATQSELGGLGDAAKRIGADTAFSARQAVQAMSELAAGGTAATDIIGGAARAAPRSPRRAAPRSPRPRAPPRRRCRSGGSRPRSSRTW